MIVDAAQPVSPVTAGQAAIWLAEQSDSLGPAYNTCTILRVRGEHGLDELDAACRQVVERTPALRLRIGLSPTSGELVQWFCDTDPAAVHHVPAGVAQHSDASANQIIEQLRRPFEVDEGPLVRFVLVDHGRHQEIALIAHHLVVDGACQLVLARRLAGCVDGGCPDQPERAYTDLVVWVRASEQRALLRDAEYWQHQLPHHFPPPLPSMPDGPEPTTLAQARIDSALIESLEFTARAKGMRLWPLLAAAIHTLLRGCGMPVPVMTLAASVRPRDGSCDDVVGGFVTQIPLVVPGEPAKSFVDLAEQAAPHWVEAARRRHFPFTELAAMACRGSGQPHARLDRVMLTYRRVPETVSWTTHATEFVVEPHRPYLSAKTDVSFRLLHHADRIDCHVEISRAVAARLSASELADRFVALLKRR